jgi:hypothetical protein
LHAAIDRDASTGTPAILGYWGTIATINHISGAGVAVALGDNHVEVLNGVTSAGVLDQSINIDWFQHKQLHQANGDIPHP